MITTDENYGKDLELGDSCIKINDTNGHTSAGIYNLSKKKSFFKQLQDSIYSFKFYPSQGSNMNDELVPPAKIGELVCAATMVARAPIIPAANLVRSSTVPGRHTRIEYHR